MWQNGAEIEVVECDSQVQRVYSYNGTTPKEISGGGGTDFDPVFSYTRRNRKVHYDGLIYLTDGYADVPTIKPPCRLLWVITPGGTKENIAFGNVIEIK
jgi:predicted metal-dependent peptidase